MTDNASSTLPPLTVNAQYIKDLSFEVPGAPAIFAEMSGTPEIPIHVDVAVNPLRESTYEVVLHLKVDATLDGKPVFIAEVAYGGIFTINTPEEHVHPMLLIECPRLLFPFARTIIADLTRDGGFPPLLVQPIDFVQLYRTRLQQQKGSAQEPAGHA